MLEDQKTPFDPPPVDTDPRPRIADSRRRLRIGLIVDSLRVSAYIRELALWGQSQEELCISHLILQTNPHSHHGLLRRALLFARRRGPVQLLRLGGLRVLTWLEGFGLRFVPEHSQHLKTFHLGAIVPHTMEVRPIISKSGRVYRYTDKDLKNIKALGLDVLIRCTKAILRGGVLGVVRFGVLSFHHGDNRINRGGPPGFWEVYLRQPTSGFVIQRLTEELDGGHVLLRGSIRTKIPYLLNQAALHSKSYVHLKRLLRQIARGDSLPLPEGPRIYFNPLHTLPPLHIQAAYTAMCALRTLRQPLNRFILRRHEHWGVAFSYQDWRSLAMWRANRLKPPPNHFVADPFVIHDNAVDYCFVEEFDCRKARACISAYRLSDTHAHRLGEAVVEPFHLSYPYLFRFGDRLYMCPETSQQRQIRLYECIGFPLQWRLAKVVMSDVGAAENMIFEHEGKWWLFTNIDPLNRHDHSSELYIFYADTPLADVWTPHARNPVYIDADRARNAGIVLERGSVFRMSQVPGFQIYGRGFAVNKISKLTTTEFSEQRLYEVGPHFFKRLRGTHHLHSNGLVCAFDFSRGETCISWPLLRRAHATAHALPSLPPSAGGAGSAIGGDVTAGATR